MMIITLLAYLIDLIYGEPRKIRHPIRLMGDFINLFTKHFYKNSITRGALLASSLIISTFIITYIIKYLSALLPSTLETIAIATIASTGIASNSLYNSVKDIIAAQNPKAKLAMLVSRDTQNMNENEIYKSSIETYSENINDGIVAPLLYLLCTGIIGLFIYKAISTLDSMVGYKTNRFIKFGKISARLDDILNFIPSRVTGAIICIINLDFKAIRLTIKQAELCESPNAGYPMAAMANCLGVSLGGKAYYNDKLKDKPILGKGKKILSKNDVLNALKTKKILDIIIIGGLTLSWITIYILK